MDNRDSALEGVGMGTSSTNAMLILENGINDITIEMGALGWFSTKNKDSKRRDSFSPESYCKLTLKLFTGGDWNVLSQMQVSVNDKGLPQVDKQQSIGGNIDSQKIMAWQTESGHFDKDYLNENYYPRGMHLYQFTQKVEMRGLPEWRWVKATPYTGKPEQIQALKDAYSELWQFFESKDNKAIKNNMKELLNAWTITTDSTMDGLYNSHQFVDDFKNKSFKMIPINWDDYQVEVMNKGRLVRFVNKSDPTIYPLAYHITSEEGYEGISFFSPIFAFIDGKFIPVI